MKIQTLLLCTVTMTLGSYAALADTNYSGPRYTPRPEISQENYTDSNHTEDRVDVATYERYENREPCQHYRKLPRNYVDPCVVPVEKEEVEVLVTSAASNTLAETQLLPIVHTYTVLFDFDKSDIRGNENETINQVISETTRYNPKQITVTGYTDSAGDMDYNLDLSERREQAVSAALLQRGVANRTIDREARGENDQAVETGDGVRNQENRRVVIDFRR